MLTGKQKALGWKEGTVAEFLGLSDAESQLVEIKLAMARALKEQREAAGLSQAELATRLQTKQPAIARMEKGEGSATLDNVILALLEAGASRRAIADLIVQAEPPAVETTTVTAVVPKSAPRVAVGTVAKRRVKSRRQVAAVQLLP